MCGCTGYTEASHEELVAGEEQPREGALKGGLKVLGEASVAVGPDEGALDNLRRGRTTNPTVRSERFTISIVHTPILSRAASSLAPLSAPSAKACPREGGGHAAATGRDSGLPPRHAGRPHGVGCRLDKLPPRLAALVSESTWRLRHLIISPATIPARPARAGGLDRLAVDHPGAGAGLAAGRTREPDRVIRGGHAPRCTRSSCEL